jgi:hypothetical protein
MTSLAPWCWWADARIYFGQQNSMKGVLRPVRLEATQDYASAFHLFAKEQDIVGTPHPARVKTVSPDVTKVE